MRTPGRCTNHETCWLANGNRDVWVSVADDFTCPVCHNPLEAPPLYAISHRGFGAAMATSLALMLVSGGLGFGLVQALRGLAGPPAPQLTAALLAPAKVDEGSIQKPAIAGANPPPLTPPPIPAPEVTQAIPPTAPVPPPVEVVIGQVSLRQNVAQVVSLPIAAPGPIGPEEFGDTESAPRWHRRAPPAAHRRTYVLPAPGWQDAGTDGTADADAMNQAEQPYPVAQGDSDMSDAGGKPDGAASVPDIPPAVLTTLTVPAVRLAPTEDQPAERVDADAAASIDDARDAPLRLTRLPNAPRDKLAVPVFPETADAVDRPGRVYVGCTITIRGEPTDCQVRAHAGGTSFVTSVMDWLHSGSVRYKPHLVHGTPIPEPRLYNVRFVP